MTTLFRILILIATVFSDQTLKAEKPKSVEDNSNLISISKVSGEAGKKLSIVTIYLDQKPKWNKLDLEAHGTFLQISLPNTLVPKPGKFYDITSPYFSKMVLIQNESNEAIIRVFTSQEASIIAKGTDIDLLNKRIVITADHSYLGKLVSKKKEGDKNPKTTAKSSPNANPKGPNKPFALDTESMPSNLIAGEENGDQFQSKLRIAAYFSIAMILLLLLSLTWRRLAINKKILSPRSSNIPMQALNHLVLAPKQKLSLVQVGHEKLLLSVSPEGISLITHIPEKNKPQMAHKTSFGEADKEKMQTIMMRNLGRQPQLNDEQSIRSFQKPKAPATQKPQGRRLKQTNKTQDINEEHTSRPVPKVTKSHMPKKKIEYAIDDNGVHKTSKSKNTPQSNTTQKAIDDVTQLIRDKLKSLPKI